MTDKTFRTPSEEKALLCRLVEGDQQAFLTLYDDYKGRIAGNLFKLLKSRELTRDILQDLFLKIWDNRAEIDTEKSFRSYLFRISENMVYDFYRKAARDRNMRDKLIMNSSEMYSHIEEDIFRKENASILQGAVSQMPTQRRQVFTLCKLEGKSYKEVEEILGIGPKTINSHLYQAGLFLKKYFHANSTLLLGIILRSVFRGL